MKAALIEAAGTAPIYTDHAAPVAKSGEMLITVAAAALYPLVRARFRTPLQRLWTLSVDPGC